MGRRAEFELTADEREVLERWARRPKSSQALALRCRIVLAAADGEETVAIAARLGCSRGTVGKWRAGSPSGAWTGCTTSRGPASPARSQTTTSSG